MRISFLFILILIIIIFFAIRGYRQGLVNILFGAVSWVFLILFVMLASPALSNTLSDNTGIADAIYEHFSSGRYKSLPGMLVSQFADGITSVIMRIIGVVFALAIALIIIWIIKFFLKEILKDKSTIGSASRVAGTIWGILEGVIISWIILAFCGVVLEGVTKGELFMDINDNFLLNILYHSNPIAAAFF